jgi:hypothetical protein
LVAVVDDINRLALTDRQTYIAQRPVLVERRRRVRGVSIMIAKLILPLSSDGRAIDLLLAGSYPHP